MEVLLQSISTSIHNNEKNKNINDIVKNYNNINDSIDSATKLLQTLKTKMEENDDNDSIDSYDENEFEKSKLEIDKLIKVFTECTDLEKRIDIYKKINKISNECIHHLEKKKLVIVECDKMNFEEKKHKPKLYSSSSDDE
ncbi:hypothetical protein BMW23_0841 [Bodo saltans virus]|uniref:Uncharacterized protein n=1 Tax=Bodo saltans virus TaxID=2024608 RepID=A0A2H4UVJ3_9VIRU|nr:hypothetical protein QJ851_gp0824 [Bodo saltans virus]ATZ80887.1 hypothetical protein BMW23_0841 [Bodo saltans virus]